MEKVVGIGGVFLKAKDPAALGAWYEKNLGIPYSEMGHVFEGEGMTVWSIFPETSDYFKSAKPFMMNYRVNDLDAMLEQLKAAGADVDANVESHEYGKFGWATDPEGNRFELWQPSGE
jgi:predicted enzyme related to lactoylglutathione lyase